jgi:hypothetical protein
LKVFAGGNTAGDVLFDRDLLLYSPTGEQPLRITPGYADGFQFKLYFIMPDAYAVTLSVQLDDQEPVVKTYTVFSEAKYTAAGALSDYYNDTYGEPNTSSNKIGKTEVFNNELYIKYSAVRYLLRSVYNDCAEAINATEDADVMSAAFEQAKIDFARAAAVVGLDGTGLSNGQPAYPYNKLAVVNAVSGYAQAPTFAYIPVTGMAIDALQAAFEYAAPGKWGIESYKTVNYKSIFVTALFYSQYSTTGGPGLGIGTNPNSGICYLIHNWYATNGFGTQVTVDRDVIRVGGVAWGSPGFDKDDLVWALAALHEIYGMEPDGTLHYNLLGDVSAEQEEAFDAARLQLTGWYPDEYRTKETVAAALAKLFELFPNDYQAMLHHDLPEAVINVMNLINAIGSVTPQSGDAITAARSAYNALPPDNKAKVPNYALLTAAEEAFAALTTLNNDVDGALEGALSYLSAMVPNPGVNSESGEWAVIALARGGRITKDSQIATNYLANLRMAITGAYSKTDGKVILNNGAPTDNARVILALSSLGIDATDFEGYDFVTPLTDSNWVTSQSINNTIFALIALDSKPYLAENTAIRATYAAHILSLQNDDGGWALDGDTTDADTTAMALQSLVPYGAQEEVYSAIQRGLAALLTVQDQTVGGFYSGGLYNSQSAAQVIVALTAMNTAPTGTNWTVMGGGNPLTALLSFYVEGSYGFKNTLSDAGINQMATEQGAYSLVAYDRYAKEQTRLYDMSDMFPAPKSDDAAVQSVTVNGTAASPIADNPHTFSVELPFGTDKAAATVVVTATDEKATVSTPATDDGGATWTFTVTAEDGDTAVTYTLSVTVASGVDKSALFMAIQTADALNSADYSPESWANLATALTNAKTQYDSTTANQIEVNIVTNALNTAIGNLISANDTITVTVSVEKFTVNGEYIVEPTIITVPRNSTASYTVKELLKAKYPDKDSAAFRGEDNYMRGVWDTAYQGNSSVDGSPHYSGYLSEKDESALSGWMYSVNNVFPSQGIAEKQLNDGDVVRFQYTIVKGDVGGSSDGLGASSLADKDALTAKIAEIRAADAESDYGAAYVNALAVLKNLASTQPEVNAALANLAPFVAVTNITGVTAAAEAGQDVNLSGTVAPSNATNKTIVWSVKDANITGASISGSTLSTTAAGTVTVTATIANGTSSGDYTQDFNITVAANAAQLLAAAKAAKIAEINAVTNGLNEAEYTAASWSALQAAIAGAVAEVQNATSIAEVNAVQVPSTSGLVALAVELAEAKAARIAQINAVDDGLNPDDYTTESWAELQNAISSAVQAVTAATDLAAVTQVAIPTTGVLVAKPAGKTLSGISITNQPTKTTYTVGDALDLAGLTVRANYSDDSFATVTPDSTSPANGAILSTMGTVTVTVTYQGKTATFSVTVNAAQQPVTYQTALNGSLAWILSHTSNPTVGSVGGEWAILARARAGKNDTAWFNTYLAALDNAIANVNDALMSRTDYERVVLAVSALGLDASSYKGHDLTEIFKTYSDAGTVNNQIFALIALNSKGYQGDADKYLTQLLTLQHGDNGWGLDATSDVDITAMALQALAPYYSNATVKAAVDKAVEWLNQQSVADAEGNAQIIVAFSALSIDAASYVEKLLTYYDSESGGFRRAGNANAMATEQAAYALAAYDRYKNNQNSLYDMTDAGTQPTIPVTDAEAVNDAAAALTWSVIRNANTVQNVVTVNLNLPSAGENGVTITWSSSNTSVISNSGKVTRPSYDEGDKTVTLTATLTKGAESKAVTFTLTVKKLSQTSITIQFRLVGDSKHDSPGAHTGYTDWVTTRDITFDGVDEVTVYEVFTKALNAAGVSYSIRDNNNYVWRVNGLSEFDNGPNSGWMYMVNGAHVDLGLSQQIIKNGDIIVWHYVDDYTKEQPAWERAFPYGTPAGLGVTDAPNNNGDPTIDDPETPLADAPENSVATDVPATVKDGAAVAEIKPETVKNLIVEAKESGKTNITLTVTESKNANTIELDLIVASLNDLVKNSMSLTVKTDNGTVTLDTATLTALAAGKSESEMVKIIVEDVTSSADLNAKQQAKVGNNPVIDLSVWVGNTQIHDFGGVVTVKLPELPANVNAEDYDLLTVYYLDDDGNITEMQGARYNAATGEITFTTTHFSKFFVSEWISPFKDVIKGSWYYRNVRYAHANGLMNGTAADQFAPDTNLSRAMLITILARDSGADTSGSATWYEKAAAWAVANGISDGTNLDANITREQMVTMLYRYAKLKGLNVSKTASLGAYSDADGVSSWATDAMAWAVANGLVTGRTLTTLAPDGTATRAEASAMLERFLENL